MSIMDLNRAAPPAYVAPPARDPARFGLFSVANMVPPAVARWENGVEWEPIACDPAGAVTGICVDPDAIEQGEAEGWPLVPRSGEGLVTSQPFAVYGSYDCSAFSRPLPEAELRARAHLAAGEERAVEWAIATGLLDNQPSFQGAVDLTPASGAVDLAAGIGVLEGYIGIAYGGIGVIHLPRRLAALLEDVASRTGQRLETLIGNYIAAGAGYDLANVGPDGSVAPEGSAWLYATSVPVIRRSDVFVTPDEEFRPQSTNNDVTVYAWRIYDVAWECVTAAVLVDAPDVLPHFDLTLSTSGTGEGTIETVPEGDRFPLGTVVELTATPDAGSEFIDWTDDLEGAPNPTSVTIDGDTSVGAVFDLED